MSNPVKHTPGPWLPQGFCYEGEERGSCFIVAENLGGLVGAALPWPTELDEGDFPRVEANARLIAAAPDMLAALQDLIKFFDATGLGTTFLNRARLVVAKAEGRP